MMSELTDIDKNIIKAVRKGNKDYAGIQRANGIGSTRTISKHVQKLERLGYVKDNKIKHGTRKFHNVNLTKKGESVK